MAHKRVVFNNKAIKFGNKLVVIEAETPPSYTITATAKSGSVVYDGSAHSVSGLVTNTFTLDGETYTLSGLTTSNPSRTAVGSSTNTISGTPVVKDSSNNVVTDRFTVNTANGTLTITARPVTVSVANKTAEYTGSRISGNTTLNWNGIVSGHTATINYTAASGTNVGTYTGSFGTNFKVMNGSTDVTANYNLGTKTPGTLTITERQGFTVLGSGSTLTGSFANTTPGYSWRGNPTPTYTASTTGGISAFKVNYAYPDGYGAGNIYLNKAINMSGYTTCTFSFDTAINYSDWIFQIGFVSAIPTNTTYGGDGWTGYTNNAELVTCAKSYLVNGATLARGTYNFSVAGLSGNYYLTVGMIQKGNSGSKTIKISSVILS